MTEAELIREFQKNRLHIVLAQLAPTALLAFAAFATPTIAGYPIAVVHSFALILLEARQTPVNPLTKMWGRSELGLPHIQEIVCTPK